MKNRPSLSLLITVALVSAAVLTVEISLTRVFAVLLRYHFAFLVISVALCGLGVGGYLAYWLQRGKAAKVLSPTWLLLGFALTIDVAMALMLRVVFAHFPTAYWLAAVLILVPFTCAGMYLATVFTQHAFWSGKLYSWDLAGAALAALLIIALLEVVSAIDACLFVAAICALAAFVLEKRQKISTFALGATIILFGIAFANRSQLWLDIPPIPPSYDQHDLKFGIRHSLADRGITQPLFTELGEEHPPSKIVDTRWNSFARTDVVVDQSMRDTYYLYTNGNVPTNMMRWDGKMSSIAPIAHMFPLNDWVFGQAPLGGKNDEPAGKVLSIGPGGGLDALLALHHNAAAIDGAEINPSIVKLMKEPYYANFNGHLYTHPRVHIKVAEGRAFVREAVAKGRKYQLLYSALTKTATASQGMALLESFVYTTDAFHDYMNALDDDGQIAVVMDDPLLLARFYATAVQVLMGDDVGAATAAQHIAIVQNTTPGPYVFAIVISKQMLTREQTFAMESSALKNGLHPIWIPDQAASTDFGPYPSVGTAQMDLPGFVNWFRQAQSLDISPCPDSRPFVMDLSLGLLPVYKQLTVVALVLALLLTGLGWVDRRKTQQTTEAATLTPARAGAFVLYFLALGTGFMLVEIPLLQQLILTLGYPTLSITVILFSILLGGGIGARFSQRFELSAMAKWAMISALLVAVITAASTFLLPTVQNSLLGLPIVVRCIVIAIALLPLGFFLGAPFPCGLRLFDRDGGSSYIPLMWGINGVASVVGSLCAAMGAKLWGFPMMLNLGALIYLIAAGLLWFSEERAGENEPGT